MQEKTGLGTALARQPGQPLQLSHGDIGRVAAYKTVELLISIGKDPGLGRDFAAQAAAEQVLQALRSSLAALAKLGAAPADQPSARAAEALAGAGSAGLGPSASSLCPLEFVATMTQLLVDDGVAVRIGSGAKNICQIGGQAGGPAGSESIGFRC